MFFLGTQEYKPDSFRLALQIDCITFIVHTGNLEVPFLSVVQHTHLSIYCKQWMSLLQWALLAALSKWVALVYVNYNGELPLLPALSLECTNTNRCKKYLLILSELQKGGKIMQLYYWLQV